jgi:predicted signal transduction protein with EAL and GGDEF domain
MVDGGPRPFAVILIHADAAPTITNTLGRDMSEQAIRLAAQRLVAEYGSDQVGQLSAETFVLLLPDVDSETAHAQTTKAAELLVRPVEVEDVPFLLDPVAGVALSPEHGRELGMLLMKAGLAATLARRRGQRAALYIRREAAITRRRIELLRELRLALRDPGRHHELGVVYQPQVDLGTGDLVGVEALLRWTDPRLGPVPTDEVIEAIESSGRPARSRVHR